MAEHKTAPGGNGEWRVVDERPFECPNGCGLLDVESSTSVWCPECRYARTVIEYVEPGEEI